MSNNSERRQNTFSHVAVVIIVAVRLSVVIADTHMYLYLLASAALEALNFENNTLTMLINNIKFTYKNMEILRR